VVSLVGLNHGLGLCENQVFGSMRAEKTPRAERLDYHDMSRPAKPGSAATSNVTAALPHHTYDTTIFSSPATQLSIRTKNYTLLVVPQSTAHKTCRILAPGPTCARRDGPDVG
jgi:hypothetical protein